MAENIENTSRSAAWREELRKAMPAKERTAIPRVAMPTLDPAYRITCNEEVNRGLSAEQAVLEATRCLDCPEPTCVQGCPVNIAIPYFVKNIQRGNFVEAAAVLHSSSALPAVCGRVCPQEKQCESKCIYNKMKKASVAAFLPAHETSRDTSMAATIVLIIGKEFLRHLRCGFASVAHGKYYSCSAADDVASGEDGRNRRLQMLIGRDSAARRHVEPVD